MAIYLMSDAGRDVNAQIYTVVGRRISVWNQPASCARCGPVAIAGRPRRSRDVAVDRGAGAESVHRRSRATDGRHGEPGREGLRVPQVPQEPPGAGCWRASGWWSRGGRDRHRVGGRQTGARRGASVLISDIHERRIGETADRLEQETGVRPFTQLCNVTVEDDVQALVAAAVGELGGIDVMMNNAGLGGSVRLVDMTDEQWSAVVGVTLDGTMRCTRAVLRHMVDGDRGCHREQRLGRGVASPGRAVPLRRSQGGRDGAHPLRRDRSRRARDSGERRCPEYRHACVSRKGQR
ncbi:MAG: SDR family oxidoreductase [Acidimicrobiales bacterium]